MPPKCRTPPPPPPSPTTGFQASHGVSITCRTPPPRPPSRTSGRGSGSPQIRVPDTAAAATFSHGVFGVAAGRQGGRAGHRRRGHLLAREPPLQDLGKLVRAVTGCRAPPPR